MIDLLHPGVAVRRAPSTTPPLPAEPADLSTLYALSDGLELADATRILARGEIVDATAWLRSERSLEWSADLWVVGEREDLVVIRDLDLAGTRAGGGVLEAPTDGLSAPARVALDVLGYLEERLGTPGASSPERAAREAAARRDAEALASALAHPFYPGADREVWHAALTLGALRAGAGDAAGAMEAFARAVEARARAAPRGAGESEVRAGWKTCAIAAEKEGAGAVAAACREKAKAPA